MNDVLSNTGYISLIPKAAEDLLLLADASEEVSDFASVLELTSRAHQTMPENPFLLALLGWAKYKCKRYEDAIKDLTSALTIHVGAKGTFFLRARCREQIGDLDGAVSDFQEAARLGLSDPEVHWGVAMIHEFRREHALAESEYLKALTMDSGNPVASRGIRRVRSNMREKRAAKDGTPY